MVIMFISRFLKQRGEKMTIKEIVEKSKAICENTTCSKCPLQNCACISKHGEVHAEGEESLIALEEYFESIEKKDIAPKGNQQKEAKGKGKK